MGKLHYLTALLLVILLAIVSSWIFESMDNSPTLTKENLRHDPDYFLKNFTATNIGENGKPTYQVKAKHLEHFPDDNSMELKHPLFSFYKNNIKIWTAQANEAVITRNNEIIYLKGQVIFNQIRSDDNPPMILTTQQLTIKTIKNIAFTKKKIKLEKGSSTIQGTGFRADMNNSKIEFLSKTRSHYVLPAK